MHLQKVTENQISIADKNNIRVWDDKESLEQIRRIFAPTLTTVEFEIFVELGKATGLNPYLKEIWAVKYDKKSAQIFIGRDGYRKSAQRSTFYDYHFADAVYINDKFEVNNGMPNHQYSLKDRGQLVGAYCIVNRKGATHPTFIYVELKEYNKGHSTWKDLPATMIKKVAEAQCLKMAFQELFANTYSEYEQWEKDPKTINDRQEELKNRLEKNLNLSVSNDAQVIEGDVVDSQVSFETIKETVEKAQMLDDLTHVIDQINLLPEDKKMEMRRIYTKRKREIEADKGGQE